MKHLSVTGDELRKAVQAQSLVRLRFGLLIIAFGEYLQFRSGGGLLMYLLGGVILAFILLVVYLAKTGKFIGAEKLSLATAVIDPLTYSVWIPVLGDYGGLMIGVYLFTILGYGFRIGVLHLRICQVSAIAGFAVVFFVGEFWKSHPIVWLSFLAILILVPAYASLLLRKLHEARAEAEFESQAKSQLLARVSHELRTPLTGIVAASQLLLLESENTHTAKRAETILGMSKELMLEIEDLLDQAKYESSALALEATPTSLHELLERVRVTLAPTAARKGLDFDLSIDPTIVDWVITDPHYLGRVLINLAGNAVKFTQSGHVRITAQLLDSTKTNYRIRFVVEDSGIGIAKEFHQRIFEPFYQVSDGTTRRFGGTGLGMSIASEVVRTMGGAIEIDSEPGKGTTFHFDIGFPRIDSPRQNDAVAADRQTIRGKHILIVDDHETNLLLVKELLEQDQHKVSTAGNAMEALTLLNANEFDVAFFDFNLSDMDGAKLLQIYRFGKLKPAPVFFLTADATAMTAGKLENSGATGVLHKPTSLQDLRQAISQVCRNEPHSEESSHRDTSIAPVKGERQHLRPVPVQLLDTARIERLRSTSTRPGFVRELLSQALSDIDLNCAQLNQALIAGNIESIRETAHALKGVCANVGAVRLVGLSSSLMTARREEIKQTKRLIDDLENVRSATSDALGQLVSQLDAPGEPDLSARLH